jgi:hypothetical protein
MTPLPPPQKNAYKAYKAYKAPGFSAKKQNDRLRAHQNAEKLSSRSCGALMPGALMPGRLMIKGSAGSPTTVQRNA